MIYELLKAVQARYNSDDGAALRAVITALWEDEAPPNSVAPYATVSLIGSAMEYTMGEDEPMPLLQFAVWDDAASSKVACQAADLIVALYNNAVLTMENGYTMIRADPITPGRKLRDPADKGWNVIVEFEFTLEKSR